MRIFIAIEIPDEIKKEIIEIQKHLPAFKRKLTEEENLHLTLKFLGEIEENKIEEVKKRLREIKFKSFEAEIDKIGFFDKRDRGIIWLNLTNCENLQKEIDQKLKGLFEVEKRFMSHLTIARTKLIKNKKEFLEELKKIKIQKNNFFVKEFKLIESKLSEKGSEYSVIEDYKLN